MDRNKIVIVNGMGEEWLAESKETIRFKFGPHRYIEVSFYGDWLEFRGFDLNGTGTLLVKPDCANKLSARLEVPE